MKFLCYQIVLGFERFEIDLNKMNWWESFEWPKYLVEGMVDQRGENTEQNSALHLIESWIGQLVETYASNCCRSTLSSRRLLSAVHPAGFLDYYACQGCSVLALKSRSSVAALTLEPLLGETMRRFSCSLRLEGERVVTRPDPPTALPFLLTCPINRTLEQGIVCTRLNSFAFEYAFVFPDRSLWSWTN